MELKKRIAELEREIESLKKTHAEEQQKLMAEQRQVISEFETKIERQKEEHTSSLRQVRSEHD